MSKGVYKKIPVERIEGFFKINGKEDSWNIIDFTENLNYVCYFNWGYLT